MTPIKTNNDDVRCLNIIPTNSSAEVLCLAMSALFLAGGLSATFLLSGAVGTSLQFVAYSLSGTCAVARVAIPVSKYTQAWFFPVDDIIFSDTDAPEPVQEAIKKPPKRDEESPPPELITIYVPEN